MRILRIFDIFMPLTKLFRPNIKQLLVSDVIKRVQCLMPAMLKRLSVLNFESLLVDLLLNDLSFSHFDLLLPPTLTIELFVIFAEVEAPVIQTFIEILRGSLFTILFKLSPTASQLRILLLQPWQDNSLSDFSMRTSQHNSNHFRSINI